MSEAFVKPENKKTFPLRLAVIFVIFSAAIILMGTFYYNSQRNKIFREEEDNLTAIASMKISQLESWRRERLVDAAVIGQDKLLIKSFASYLSSNSREAKTDIYDWMKSVRNDYDYKNVLIADTSFKVRLSVIESDTVLDDSIRKELKIKLKSNSPLLTDLHVSKEISYIHLDILIPLFDSIHNKQVPIGVAIIRIDPDKILFPLIQSWPTQSKSSETLLLRREGDSVLYINELRHAKNTALNLKLPLTNENLLATKAVNGLEGQTEGIDYRNIPVIGSVHKIPGTAWYMVAKVDKAEILMPLKKYSLAITIVVILLILINASIFGFWIWQQRIKFYRSQLKNEDSIHELEERFTTAFRMSPVSVTISSISDNRFIDVNNTFLKDMEYDKEDVIGRTAKELDIWADENERLWIINEIGTKGKVFGKVISYKTRTGKILYGLSSMSVVKVNGEPCNLSTVVNITESKKAELKLIESEELFRELFENMLNGFAYCKMICEDGKPLDFIYLNVNEAFATLTGLKDVVGKKVSEAIPGIQEADPELLERYNSVSSTGIPEVFETYVESLKMWFSISVYSPQKGYFVAVFDVITARKLTEDKLQETNEYLSNLFNYANAPIIVWDSSLLITRFNLAFEELSGYSSTEVIGKRIDILFSPEKTESSLTLINSAVKGKRWETVEIEIQRKDGDLRVVLWNSANIHDKDGKNVIATIAQGNDITDRKHAENSLLKSEERFRSLYENATIGIYRTTIDGKILMANPTLVKMLGFTSFEELSQRNLEEEGYEPDYPRAKFLKTLEIEGKIIGLESAWHQRNGNTLYVRESASVIRDEGGKILYYDGNVEDITYRKQAEEALQESEERFSKSFRTSPISFIIANLEDGRIIEINDAFTNISGFSRNESIGNTTLDMKIWVNEEDRKYMIDSLREGKPILHKEILLRGKGGNVAIVLLSAQVIKLANRNCIISSIEDITERKRAEDALRESEDKFKYIFEHSALGNSITHPNGETHFNNSFCEMLGYSEGELVKMKWQDFTHPDDFEITQKVLDTLSSRESDSPRFIKRYLKKDGSVMWADVSTSLRYDNDDRPLYFMTTVNDITDLKLAEEVLRNDEKRFRELIEALPQLYWTCRVEGPCDYLSRQWVEYTGLPESVQLGYKWIEQLHPEDREKTITDWAEKVKTGTSFDIEFRIRRYDGEYHWFKTRAVPIHDSEGRLIRWLGSNTDIDSVRKAEEQLRNYNKDLEQRVILRTEQLETANKELESFSYSVSHDLRAPLRAVHGYTKILLEDFSDTLDDEGRRICGIISGSATQMGELIDDLLSFSRIGRSELSASVIDMKKMTGVIFEGITSPTERERIKLKIGKLQKTYGDVKLMGQVWTNLISNAIKYTSKNVVSEIQIGSSVSDNMVTYFIKDNGVGFDMQYSHKLFGVFQRLHSESEFEGNGVGLAIVQRIILKHGGKVWAEGEVGKGATFFFSLPTARPQDNN